MNIGWGCYTMSQSCLRRYMDTACQRSTRAKCTIRDLDMRHSRGIAVIAACGSPDAASPVMDRQIDGHSYLSLSPGGNLLALTCCSWLERATVRSIGKLSCREAGLEQEVMAINARGPDTANFSAQAHQCAV